MNGTVTVSEAEAVPPSPPLSFEQNSVYVTVPDGGVAVILPFPDESTGTEPMPLLMEQPVSPGILFRTIHESVVSPPLNTTPGVAMNSSISGAGIMKLTFTVHGAVAALSALKHIRVKDASAPIDSN